MNEHETLEIEVNGAAHTTTTTTLGALLREVYGELPLRGVAAAVGGAVVPRSMWEEHELEPGDRVEVIRATQGG